MSKKLLPRNVEVQVMEPDNGILVRGEIAMMRVRRSVLVLLLEQYARLEKEWDRCDRMVAEQEGKAYIPRLKARSISDKLCMLAGVLEFHNNRLLNERGVK